MSSIQCEVVPGTHNMPHAVLGPRTLVVENGWWVLELQEVEAWHRMAATLLGLQAVFDAKLSKRWGRLVACRPTFSLVWRFREGEPTGHTITRLQ